MSYKFIKNLDECVFWSLLLRQNIKLESICTIASNSNNSSISICSSNALSSLYDYYSEGDDDSTDKLYEESSSIGQDNTIPVIDHDDGIIIKNQRLAKMKEHQKYFTEKIQETTTQTSNSKVHNKRMISDHSSYESENHSDEPNNLVHKFILLGTSYYFILIITTYYYYDVFISFFFFIRQKETKD